MIEFLVLLLILAIILQVLLWTAIVQIEQYESGVLQSGKDSTELLNPGWHFVIPFRDKVTKVDLRTHYLDFPTRSFGTHDSKTVNLATTLSYKILDPKKSVLQASLASSITPSPSSSSHHEKTDRKLSKIIELTLKNFVSKIDREILISEKFDDSQIIERLDVQVKDLGIKIEDIEIHNTENKIEYSDKWLSLSAISSNPITSSSFFSNLFPFRSVRKHNYGLLFNFGKFEKVLSPDDAFFSEGSQFHTYLIPPVSSKLYEIDRRHKVIETSRQEILTRDKSRTNVKARIKYRVSAPSKALMTVTNYRRALIHIIHSSVREYASQTSLFEISDSEMQDFKFTDILNKNLEFIGIEVNKLDSELIEAGSSYFISATSDKELPLKALKQDKVEMEVFYENSTVFHFGFSNLFTQRSLRLYLGLGFFGSASSYFRKFSSTLYALFTLFYFLVSLIWGLWCLAALVMVVMDVGVTANLVSTIAGISALLILLYIFFYLPVIFFLNWAHGSWTKKEFEKSLKEMHNHIENLVNEISKSTNAAGTLNELYTIRSEILKCKEEGMVTGDLLDEIEVLENKFISEAKQNISIEEIGKLQQEFISSLQMENYS